MALLELIVILVLQFGVGNGQEKIYHIFQPEQDVTLPCGSPSSSGPLQCSKILWLFNRDFSETFVESRRGTVNRKSLRADRLSLDANCSLVIKRVTAEDVGLYTCRQRDFHHYDVSVYLSLFTIFPTPTDSDSRSSSDVRLECSLLRYRGLSSCQPNSLRWVDETGAVITDGVTKSSRHADCFSDLKAMWIGNNKTFTCQSVNQENNVEIQADYTPLVKGTQRNTTVKADIMLLVDGSWSIGRTNFRTIRSFIARIVAAFDIGPDTVQIGLAQYSGDPETEWHLNAHKTKESLLNAVANLPYKGGSTMTGLALNYILNNNFKPEVGMREDSHKLGILLTDGKSQDNVIMVSQTLRAKGIELYAIGVKNADVNELKSIASDPHETHVYHVWGFSHLLDIVDNLTDNLFNSIKGPVGCSREDFYHFSQPEQVITLPCGAPSPSGRVQCSETSWFYSRTPSNALIEANEGKTNPRSLRAGRLSLDANCFLVIKRVTAEDVGLYTCRRGDSERYDVSVYLSLIKVSSKAADFDPSRNDEIALECSLLSYRGLRLCRPNGLRWVNETGAVMTDGVTKTFRDESCFSDLNVTHQSGYNRKFTCQFVNKENNVEIQANYTPVHTGSNSRANLYRFSQLEQAVTLSCDTPSPSGPLQCSNISWLYSRALSNALRETNGGKINPRSLRAGRLSLDTNCSLVINRVTTEDVGLYTCRRGDSDHYDVNVYLSVFTVSLIPEDLRRTDELTLECSLLKDRDLHSCQPNSLRWVSETGAVITDGVTESFKDEDCLSSLNVMRQSSNKTFTCQFVNQEGMVEIQANYTPVFTDWSPLSSIMLVLRISALVLMILSTVLVFNLRGSIKPPCKMHEDVIEADYENAFGAASIELQQLHD
ncbi:uncharacterized protein LOC121521082 [Cheilinus undulatus]|uniref:uncharacterized protein LOC121521082 n=1 Tax=Cheilinus undulatus TaxID=241271 RepID=UPI001BD3004C|nr:uncharacterized protein LOC121521082 [Cheilinus undulatus]